MGQTACVLCEKELSGGLDTFGPSEAPLCWGCWTDEGIPEVMKDLGGGEPMAGQDQAGMKDDFGPLPYFYTRP